MFKQDPAAGTDVKRGDTVTYWVSSGKPQATVPDLTNLTQADAEAALADAGLKLGRRHARTTSTTVPAGLGHQPGPGRRREGRQGLGGELRRLHRLAVADPHADAEPERQRRRRAQRATACSPRPRRRSSARSGSRSRSARRPTPASSPARW